jgi:hypothetical protein
MIRLLLDIDCNVHCTGEHNFVGKDLLQFQRNVVEIGYSALSRTKYSAAYSAADIDLPCHA